MFRPGLGEISGGVFQPEAAASSALAVGVQGWARAIHGEKLKYFCVGCWHSDDRPRNETGRDPLADSARLNIRTAKSWLHWNYARIGLQLKQRFVTGRYNRLDFRIWLHLRE